MRIFFSGLLASILSVASVFAAADGDQDLPPPEKTAGVNLHDPGVIQKGMSMLSSTCGGYCHGTEGRGFKAPSLRNRTDLSTDALRATILYGRKRAGKLMPAWNGVLSEQDVWTVIAALVSLRHVEPDAGVDGKPGAHYSK
jgi:mono/diheme cytochrome c family protein